MKKHATPAGSARAVGLIARVCGGQGLVDLQVFVIITQGRDAACTNGALP